MDISAVKFCLLLDIILLGSVRATENFLNENFTIAVLETASKVSETNKGILVQYNTYGD